MGFYSDCNSGVNIQYVYHVQIFDHADFGKLMVDAIFASYDSAWKFAEEKHELLKKGADDLFKGSYEVSVLERILF